MEDRVGGVSKRFPAVCSWGLRSGKGPSTALENRVHGLEIHSTSSNVIQDGYRVSMLGRIASGGGVVVVGVGGVFAGLKVPYIIDVMMCPRGHIRGLRSANLSGAGD